MKYQLRTYIDDKGREPFTDWLSDIKDLKFRAKLSKKVLHFSSGNFGDLKSVGGGVLESRLHFGPGFRIYFAIEGAEIILLILGGDKRCQAKDIKKAKEYLKNFKKEDNHGSASR